MQTLFMWVKTLLLYWLFWDVRSRDLKLSEILYQNNISRNGNMSREGEKAGKYI